MTIGDRLKLLRGSASRETFANMLGIHPQSLYRYEQGIHKVDISVVASACEKLGVSSDWLIFGKKSSTPTEGTDLASLTKCTCDVDLVMIPMVEARLSAGTGSLQVNGDVERSYAFRSDFLHRKGNPTNMVMMRVEGDSMQPEIMNNDVVLLDQSKKEIRTGRIFAVGFEDAIYLKRIDKLPGKLVLKSINPDYPPVELDIRGQNSDAFRVIGQVIWCGREY